MLLSPRFRGRIRVDARAKAIFPHENEAGLCGFEKRNRNFKSFAYLGEKGRWMSNAFSEDRRLGKARLIASPTKRFFLAVATLR